MLECWYIENMTSRLGLPLCLMEEVWTVDRSVSMACPLHYHFLTAGTGQHLRKSSHHVRDCQWWLVSRFDASLILYCTRSHINMETTSGEVLAIQLVRKLQNIHANILVKIRYWSRENCNLYCRDNWRYSTHPWNRGMPHTANPLDRWVIDKILTLTMVEWGLVDSAMAAIGPLL